MTTSTVTSIVFTTASGRPVEVSCAQMEIARNRLWGSDFQVPSCSSSSAKATDQPPKNSSTEEKENEYNFFDDDDFDDDFDLLMETFVPSPPAQPTFKRPLQEVTSNSNKKRKSNDD